MIIEQTIEIPASRRIAFDIPPEFPAGERATIIVLAKDNEEETPPRRRTYHEDIEYCHGLGKRLGVSLTSDRLIEMRREDKAREEAKRRRMVHKEEARIDLSP